MGFTLGLMLGWAWLANAQEPSLEQCRMETIQLRKQLAQAMFQAATMEEQVMALKKQAATEKK